jgi:secreted trypsin-like serine protease
MKLNLSYFFLLVIATGAVEESARSKPRKLRRDQAQSASVRESRIVGGNRASPGEYPYFVQWDGCGASLIHEDVILSAAHCNQIDSNEVWVGAYLVGTSSAGAQARTITTRRVHPYYYDDGYSVINNDYLVMKLDQSVRNLSHISDLEFCFNESIEN